MASRKKTSAISNEEEDTKTSVVLVVHTTSGEDFEIALNDLNEQQLENVNTIVGSAFFNFNASKMWRITDTDNVDYSFNSDHIVLIEVRPTGL